MTPTPGSKEAEDPVHELSQPLVFTKEMLDRSLTSEGWPSSPPIVAQEEKKPEKKEAEVEFPSSPVQAEVKKGGGVEKKEEAVAVKEEDSKAREEVEVYLSGNNWRMEWGNGLVEREG